MKRLIFISLFSLSFFAEARTLEVWFLTKASYVNFMKKWQGPRDFFSESLAANLSGDQSCIPMGNQCFDPQYGLRDLKFKKVVKGAREKSTSKNIGAPFKASPLDKSSLGAFGAVDRNLVKCEKGDYFDIFCGQAKDFSKTPYSLEIWFDISSSMSEVDPPPSFKQKGHCMRRAFVKRLQSVCGGPSGIGIHVYTTSLKEIDTLDTVCLNYGLNDSRRLMKWIDASEAKHLVVITDIDEADARLREFLLSQGARIRGYDSSGLVAKELESKAASLKKYCPRN